MEVPATVTKPAQAAIEFKLDEQTIHAFEGESILKAARRHGVEIPHLCCKDGLRADGNCRACVVEIKGERTLAPSCCRNVTAGMEVQTRSERARKSQKMVLEMLLSDMPDVGYKWNDGSRGMDCGSPDRSPGQAKAAMTNPCHPGLDPGSSVFGQHGEL